MFVSVSLFYKLFIFSIYSPLSIPHRIFSLQFIISLLATISFLYFSSAFCQPGKEGNFRWKIKSSLKPLTWASANFYFQKFLLYFCFFFLAWGQLFFLKNDHKLIFKNTRKSRQTYSEIINNLKTNVYLWNKMIYFIIPNLNSPQK